MRSVQKIKGCTLSFFEYFLSFSISEIFASSYFLSFKQNVSVNTIGKWIINVANRMLAALMILSLQTDTKSPIPNAG